MIVECNNCETSVEGVVLNQYSTSEEEMGLCFLYSFIKCPQCENPFIVQQVDFGEGWAEPTMLFPSQHIINPNYPDPIKKAYSEAQICYKSKAYTATAIMCRKTLEGICNEHKISERNLKESLKMMKDNGFIENRLYEWADALRISGNEAVHDLNVTVDKEDAKDIIEFTNALLEYVFTFKDKYDQYKERQKRKNEAKIRRRPLTTKS